MKFDDLEAKMRAYENVDDPCALPGVYLVARLDGRSFTRLTKELHTFETPFDPRFHGYMLNTLEHLMESCGLKVIYGYTQSDEMSLLFGPEERGFGRKLRKLLSILAGEASACFTLCLGAVASFDCRVLQLPSLDVVIDYFRWRAEDAHRNALNAHCYWLLRRNGKTSREATAALRGLTRSAKNELLFAGGINFNDVPAWQKRGAAVHWESREQTGANPLTGESVLVLRRGLKRAVELPAKEAYSAFLKELITREFPRSSSRVSWR